MKVSYDQVRELTHRLGVSKTVDFGEFWKGINTEMEHAGTIHKYSNGCIDTEEIAASIALDHLKEDPHYYTKLQQLSMQLMMPDNLRSRG